MKKIKIIVIALLLVASFFLGSCVSKNASMTANATNSSNLSIIDMLSITDKTLYKVFDSKDNVTCYVIVVNNRLDAGNGIDCQ